MQAQPDNLPKGIEFGIDGYFQKPVLKFGYGKHTCSLTAARIKHILQAIRDNGSDTVIKMMEELLTMQGKLLPTTAKITVVHEKPHPVKTPKPQTQPPTEIDFSFENENETSWG